MRSFKAMMLEASPDTKPVIMLDLDGVMADLMTGVRNLTGLDLNQWKVRAKKMADSKGNVPPEVSSNRVWQHVRDEGPGFWAKLPWMSDGKKLWGFLKNHEVEVLSATPRKEKDPKENGRRGKTAWVERNLKLPKAKINIVRREDKQKYAKGALLIDDHAKNISEFIAAGGQGIHHTSAANTIRQLKKLGFE